MVQGHDFVEYDEKNRQSTSRIPVKDKEAVEKAFRSMAELFGAFARSLADKTTEPQEE